MGQWSRVGQGYMGRQKANNVNSGTAVIVWWPDLIGYHLAQCAIAHISVYFLCWLQKRLVPLFELESLTSSCKWESSSFVVEDDKFQGEHTPSFWKCGVEVQCLITETPAQLCDRRHKCIFL